MPRNTDGEPERPQQGVYWLLTIPAADWNPPEELPEGIKYLKGQREIGATTGYNHWQVLVLFEDKKRVTAVKSYFTRTTNCLLSRSIAADAYVWKDDTAVPGTRFCLGERPPKSNSKPDWDRVLDRAIAGDLKAIPSGIYLRHLRTLETIRDRHVPRVTIEREVAVFWGKTGCGKSHMAHERCLATPYSKNPGNKWWCGYDGQEDVIIDEFRGGIDISDLLRWLDKWPIDVEIKGGSKFLQAKRFFITSNLSPEEWYPALDRESMEALKRKLGTVTHFETRFSRPQPVIDLTDEILNEIFE